MSKIVAKNAGREPSRKQIYIIYLEWEGGVMEKQKSGIRWEGNYTSKELSANENAHENDVDVTLVKRDLIAIVVTENPAIK